MDKEDLEALENVTPDDANREMRDQKDTIQGVTTGDGTGDKKAPKHKTLTRIMCFDVFDVDGSGTTKDVVWWIIKETKSLARAKFLREWEGRSLAVLFEYTRATMPENNPGSLTDAEFVDVIAYMLSVSGMPAADEELQADPQSLARSVIQQQP